MTAKHDYNTDHEGPRGILSQLRNQSTIYKRHERRLAQTYALKGDERPAVVRVLSGLPVFRIFIQPYKPESENKTQHLGIISHGSIYSEHSPTKPATDTCQRSPYEVIFSALVAGASSELLFGAAATTFSSKSVTKGKTLGTLSPFQAVPASGVLSLSPKSSSSRSLSSLLLYRGISWRQVASGAGFTALLFGSKSLVESNIGHDNDYFAASSLLSSAGAGATVATVMTPLYASRSHATVMGSLGEKTSPSLAKAATSLARNNGIFALFSGARTVYASEMLGATIYFASYSAIKNQLSRDQNQSKASNTAIATSGAAAGCLYRSTMLALNRSQAQSVSVASRLLPTILRAAPANALLFLAYEATSSSITINKQ